jgi:uncharacterized protein (UPF0332 family)
MSLKVLENQGFIKQLLPIDPKNVKGQLDLADQKLKSSKRYFDEDPEDAYKKSYAGALAAGRALMAALGWRPAGEFKHLSVEKFLELYLDPKLIRKFHGMRNKRNISEYEQAGNISIIEAENAISDSKVIISEIKTKIEKLGFQV